MADRFLREESKYPLPPTPFSPLSIGPPKFFETAVLSFFSGFAFVNEKRLCSGLDFFFTFSLGRGGKVKRKVKKTVMPWYTRFARLCKNGRGWSACLSARSSIHLGGRVHSLWEGREISFFRQRYYSWLLLIVSCNIDMHTYSLIYEVVY